MGGYVGEESSRGELGVDQSDQGGEEGGTTHAEKDD